ncbi:MAG: hypothetical protein KDE50_26585 [Caldilineaceae bacterium]|nr:hypothetical protein [Caldilineaceae bacterium]MCB0143490.1 hypothetical protein [Caldilineaceae bacterium]
MSSSASSQPNGILFDTNVLSHFAKIGRLSLLLQVFTNAHRTKQLYVSPMIHRELEIGLQHGASYLQNAVQLIAEQDIQIIHPTKADRQFMHSLPAKLAAGEAEAIALCHRLNLVFISHDRKAVNFCERMGIPSVKFEVFINRLRLAELLTADEIAEMLG